MILAWGWGEGKGIQHCGFRIAERTRLRSLARTSPWQAAKGNPASSRPQRGERAGTMPWQAARSARRDPSTALGVTPLERQAARLRLRLRRGKGQQNRRAGILSSACRRRLNVEGVRRASPPENQAGRRTTHWRASRQWHPAKPIYRNAEGSEGLIEAGGGHSQCGVRSAEWSSFSICDFRFSIWTVTEKAAAWPGFGGQVGGLIAEWTGNGNAALRVPTKEQGDCGLGIEPVFVRLRELRRGRRRKATRRRPSVFVPARRNYAVTSRAMPGQAASRRAPRSSAECGVNGERRAPAKAGG